MEFHKKIPGPISVKIGDATSLENHLFALLSTSRDADIDRVIKCRNSDHTPKECPMEWDSSLVEKVGSLPLELRGR